MRVRRWLSGSDSEMTCQSFRPAEGLPSTMCSLNRADTVDYSKLSLWLTTTTQTRCTLMRGQPVELVLALSRRCKGKSVGISFRAVGLSAQTLALPWHSQSCQFESKFEQFITRGAYVHSLNLVVLTPNSAEDIPHPSSRYANSNLRSR